MALLGLPDGIAAEVFAELGLAIDPVRELVVDRLGSGSDEVLTGGLPFSKLAKKVLEVSLREALSLGHQHIGSEHLLLAIVRVSDGGASQILVRLGVDAGMIRREVGKRVPGVVAGRPVAVARRSRGGGVAGVRPARSALSGSPGASPPPRQPPAREWIGPPEGALPGVVPLELVIAGNERAVVFLGRVAAFPAGFEFEIRVLAAIEGLDPSLNGPYARPGGGDNAAEMLRFAVQFPDGARATNYEFQRPVDGLPTPPFMVGRGGRGSTLSWSQSFWVWPLPPPGALAFNVEWPAAGLQARVEVDAQTILDAAARSIIVFPGQPEPRKSRTSSTVSFHRHDESSQTPPSI